MNFPYIGAGLLDEVATAMVATDANEGLAQQRAQREGGMRRHIGGAAGCAPAGRAECAGATAWHKEAVEATWVRPRSRLHGEKS